MGGYIIKDAYQKLQEIWAQREGYTPPHREPKRRVGTALWLTLAVGMTCLVYWGGGNHLAVEVPVVDGATIEKLQREKSELERKVADYKTLVSNLSVQIKSRNFVIAQYEQQLKALAVSVPPQPVILQAIHKEAATPDGFKRVVARSFGKDLAGRIRVIE